MTLPVTDDPVDIEEAWRTEVMLRLVRLEDMLRVVIAEVQRAAAGAASEQPC